MLNRVAWSQADSRLGPTAVRCIVVPVLGLVGRAVSLRAEGMKSRAARARRSSCDDDRRRFRDAHTHPSIPRLLPRAPRRHPRINGEDRVRRICRLARPDRANVAGTCDNAGHFARVVTGSLADSDDALPPHGAPSRAAVPGAVTAPSERIEGLTFDRCNGPRAHPERCGLEPHLHGAATARPLRRRLIPDIGLPERVRRTSLGPWVNGPRACGALRHRARRQQRVQRRRAVRQFAQTGVVSRVPCDSRRAAARGMDRNTYQPIGTAQYPENVATR